jgi:hypothetical protein
LGPVGGLGSVGELAFTEVSGAGVPGAATVGIPDAPRQAGRLAASDASADVSKDDLALGRSAGAAGRPVPSLTGRRVCAADREDDRRGVAEPS